MTFSSRASVLRHLPFVASLALVPLVLFGCGNPSGDAPATLEIRVKDHRHAIDDFKSLRVTVAALRLSPDPSLKSGDPGWIELTPKTRTFDLTRYKDGASLVIYQGEPPPQRFAAIDLKVSQVNGVLASTNAAAKVENHIRPIRAAFATEPGVEVALVLDLEVFDMSDHPGRGYEIRVRGYELFAAGELVERVPPG